MKIGVLTHHWLYNFGANLQAMATIRCLKELGHDPIILNYRLPELVTKYDSMVTAEQLAAHHTFAEQHLPQTPVCENAEQVSKVAQDAGIEVAISGSDAVLRIDPSSQREDLRFPNPFWLDWCDSAGIRRSGFLAASSMGSNFLSLTRKERRRIGETLNRLSYIGIRDQWTTHMLGLCKSSNQLNFCPDPVSVFNEVANDVLEKPETSDRYIVMSLYKKTVSQDWIKSFVAAAHQKDLKVFSLPHPEWEVEGPFDKVLRLPMCPLQWYSWIQNAAGYVGVRFHPIMISVANNVPFVALDQYQNGLKFKNRFINQLARPLKLFLRYSSKTYDVTKRAGKEKYCLNRWQYPKKSPEAIFDILYQQIENPQSNDFPQKASGIFRDTLRNITGG